QDPHQALPARLRRSSVLLRRPSAALRALLFGRSGAACRHSLGPLRQGHPHRPDFHSARRSRSPSPCRRLGASTIINFVRICNRQIRSLSQKDGTVLWCNKRLFPFEYFFVGFDYGTIERNFSSSHPIFRSLIDRTEGVLPGGTGSSDRRLVE